VIQRCCVPFRRGRVKEERAALSDSAITQLPLAASLARQAGELRPPFRYLRDRSSG
jgi:hypothetical protein